MLYVNADSVSVMYRIIYTVYHKVGETEGTLDWVICVHIYVHYNKCICVHHSGNAEKKMKNVVLIFQC